MKKSVLCSILILLVFCSCQKGRRFFVKQEPSWKKNKIEMPKAPSESEMMAKISNVAVLPFIDATDEKNHTINRQDLINFAKFFSNHLVGSKTFKSTLYPQQALEQLRDSEYSVSDKGDLKEIGNLLNVDALIFGKINDYNMYSPPHLSISMKFYLTRLERFASYTEVSALAHSGVPLHNYNPTFFKQLWDTSAYYDSSNDIFHEILTHYLKTHRSSYYGSSNDRYLRTKSDFFDVIAYDLANSLNQSKRREENTKPAPFQKGKQRPPLPSGYFHHY